MFLIFFSRRRAVCYIISIWPCSFVHAVIESDLFAIAERRPPSPALSPDAKEWSPAAAMFVSVEAVIGNQICEGELQKVDRGTIFADVLQCTRAAAKEGLSHISQQVKVKIKKSLTKRSVNVAELSWPVMETMKPQGMDIVEFSFPGIDPTPLPSPIGVSRRTGG